MQHKFNLDVAIEGISNDLIVGDVSLHCKYMFCKIYIFGMLSILLYILCFVFFLCIWESLEVMVGGREVQNGSPSNLDSVIEIFHSVACTISKSILQDTKLSPT